ncbi:MAG: DUF4384 domain-containing protein [Treponema sp.]
MKRFMVTVAALCAAGALYAQKSIREVIGSFDERLARRNIPTAEIAVGGIYFGESGTSGTAAGWMKDEIAKAASNSRRIKLVRPTLSDVQAAQAVKSRGLPSGMTAAKAVSAKKKYTLTGKYIENKAKGLVSLTLNLEVTENEETVLFASDTAVIPAAELAEYDLTLYPQNIAQAEAIAKDFAKAESLLESKMDAGGKSRTLATVQKQPQADATPIDMEMKADNAAAAEGGSTTAQADLSAAQDDEKSGDSEKSTGQSPKSFAQTASTAPKKENGAVQITAAMLDSENCLADTLHPGDTVKFMVSTNQDSFIRIMGIDANGNAFWLPVKDNFMPADAVRTFPDDEDTDYQVVDGVYGAEHLFIYAASDKSQLPDETSERKYRPSLITNTTRGITGVKKHKKLTTGVFKISYTVEP